MLILKTDPFVGSKILKTYDEFVSSYLLETPQHKLFFVNYADYQPKTDKSTYAYLPVTTKQIQQFEHNKKSYRQLYLDCKHKPIFLVEEYEDSDRIGKIYQASLSEIDPSWLPDADAYCIA